MKNSRPILVASLFMKSYLKNQQMIKVSDTFEVSRHFESGYFRNTLNRIYRIKERINHL